MSIELVLTAIGATFLVSYMLWYGFRYKKRSRASKRKKDDFIQWL